MFQYGGSPVKVGEEEYSLFRDHEYVLLTVPLIVGYSLIPIAGYWPKSKNR
jgi:hypothetical protein